MSSAEATIRGLKEQSQRMKTSVQQVRAQCANDVRKRDLEMQKLKSHLADRQRGKRDGLGVTTININPAVDRGSKLKSFTGSDGVHEPGYSLRQETNDFLTELCQNLSNENDTLIALARSSIQTLNEVQGLPHVGEEEDNSNGTASINTHRSSQGPVTNLPASCEELSSQMEGVLDHLRTLLTNPSFVPLEEVEMRDEEINRLRDGWEKMETRWKHAVSMMDGWHQRISDGGDSIQVEELKMGMQLDSQLESSNMNEESMPTSQSPIQEDVQAEEEEESASRSRDERRAKPAVTKSQVDRHSNRALKETSDNIKPSRSPRKVAFSTDVRKSPEPREEDDTLPVKAYKTETVTRRPSRKKSEPRPREVRHPTITTRRANTFRTRKTRGRRFASD